jgi:hypothetical protein
LEELDRKDETPAPFQGARHFTRDEAWSAAGLDLNTLHECRPTYASSMFAAGFTGARAGARETGNGLVWL